MNVCRDLPHFWGHIKTVDGSWEPRRKHVRDALTPLFDLVEGTHRKPVDAVASDVLQKFDADGVAAVWQKALDRRHIDPEDAITAARSLLETVCKHILEKTGTAYGEKDDLPALYRATAKQLNLAPSQHTEEIFKQILGGVTAAIEGSARSEIGSVTRMGKVRDQCGRCLATPSLPSISQARSRPISSRLGSKRRCRRHECFSGYAREPVLQQLP